MRTDYPERERGHGERARPAPGEDHAWELSTMTGRERSLSNEPHSAHLWQMVGGSGYAVKFAVFSDARPSILPNAHVVRQRCVSAQRRTWFSASRCLPDHVPNLAWCR